MFRLLLLLTKESGRGKGENKEAEQQRKQCRPPERKELRCLLQSETRNFSSCRQMLTTAAAAYFTGRNLLCFFLAAFSFFCVPIYGMGKDVTVSILASAPDGFNDSKPFCFFFKKSCTFSLPCVFSEAERRIPFFVPSRPLMKRV